MHMTSTVLRGEHEHHHYHYNHHRHYHHDHDDHYQVTITTTLSLYLIYKVEAFTILIMRAYHLMSLMLITVLYID